MASLPADLDPNDPINILLRPFDAVPPPIAATTSEADPNAHDQADAQASQAALDAAAAAEAERQRKLAEEKANILRQQTVGGKNNNTIFGGAEGEVLYESNVRPSARRWESTNRVEVKRSVVDFNMSDPLPPEQLVGDNAPSLLSSSGPASPIAFSQPIQVELVAPVASAPPARPAATAAAAAAAPTPTPKPAARPVAAAGAAQGEAVFSPTAGVHPTTANNKTEEFMKKVGGGAKVRQCPSFRMLEFQIQYEDYKLTKTAVS